MEPRGNGRKDCSNRSCNSGIIMAQYVVEGPDVPCYVSCSSSSSGEELIEAPIRRMLSKTKGSRSLSSLVESQDEFIMNDRFQKSTLELINLPDISRAGHSKVILNQYKAFISLLNDFLGIFLPFHVSFPNTFSFLFSVTFDSVLPLLCFCFLFVLLFLIFLSFFLCSYFFFFLLILLKGIAKTIGRTILSETHLPLNKKTIQPKSLAGKKTKEQTRT